MVNIDFSKQFVGLFDQKKCRNIDFVVLHHIQANSLTHAISQLKEHQVSSHFIINEDGKIYNLVAENNISYHAGVSNWQGIEGINKFSIGIELINKNPQKNKFSKKQLKATLELCLYLKEKYQILTKNFIGHSDIAYNKETGLHNRKQDPSHLFDWAFFAKNNIGIFAKSRIKNDLIFKLKDKNLLILEIKKKLKKIGYRIANLDDCFDLEMQSLAVVFNRKFLGKEDLNFWTKKSEAVLNKLVIENSFC